MEDRSAHDPFAPKSVTSARETANVSPLPVIRRLQRAGASQVVVTEANRRWDELNNEERADAVNALNDMSDEEFAEALVEMEKDAAAEDTQTAETVEAICGYTETDENDHRWICRLDAGHDNDHHLEEFVENPDALTGVVEAVEHEVEGDGVEKHSVGEEAEVAGDGTGDASPVIEGNAVAGLTETPHYPDGEPMDIPDGGPVSTAEPEPIYEVPDGTVDEVTSWVGDDKGRAFAALRTEKAKSEKDRRKTLIEALEKLTA